MAAGSSPLPAFASPIPELLQRIKDDPHSIFGQGHKELVLSRAPGRLDIMGGTADYSGALVCEMPLDAAAAVALQRRDDRRLVIRSYNFESFAPDASNTIELSLDDFYGTAALLPDTTLQQLFDGQRQWAACIAGIYPMLARHKKITRRTPGANIACYSTVPEAGGSGSSAALSSAALSAVAAAYHIILEPLEMAVLAQQLEHHVGGAPVGISAAATAVLGKKDQILLLDCQPHDPRGYLPIPSGCQFAGICTGLNDPVVAAAWRTTRTSAFLAQAIVARMYKDLGSKRDPTGGYLANLAPDLYRKYFRPILPESIDGRSFLDHYGPIVDRTVAVDPTVVYAPRTAADYHVMENVRVHEFVDHLKAIDADPAAREREALAAGAIMLDSQKAGAQSDGLRLATTEIVVDLLLQHGAQRGIYGAKSRGGMVTVFAAATDAASAALKDVCQAYQQKTGAPARLFTASSPGSANVPPLKMPLAEL